MDEQGQAATEVIKGQNITAQISKVSFDSVLTPSATDSIASGGPSQFILIQRPPLTSAGECIKIILNS